MKILAKEKDGFVSITNFKNDSDIETYRSQIDPEGTGVIIDDTLLPDRYFFNAFYLENGKVSVNLEKAKGIHLNYIRSIRTKAFADLDRKAQIAFERSDTTEYNRIKEMKEQLRDLGEVKLPGNLMDLKLFIPEILKPYV